MTNDSHTVSMTHRIKEWVATGLGVTPESRAKTVSAMFDTDLHSSVGYWFQLVVAMVIATLGLALNSTAVVIGAMLVSPLMAPIVRFGMGLATGSPVLAIRSLARTGLSVIVVISCAALLTLLLPFQEVTPEIAARTTPTALDLFVAAACALAAAYTTVRPASETAATAAGTAIGIALVPPLCVVGFGLGASQWSISAGASLLFVANLCAILLVATIMFILLGFDEIDIETIEGRDIAGARARHPAERAARLLQKVFGSRYVHVLRILMPVVLLIVVYVPLRHALEEVTWQVRVRSGVNLLLQDTELARDAVRTQVAIEKGTIVVRLVVLGSADEAVKLEETLRTRIAAVSGVVPTVDVVSVPDAEAMAATLQARRERSNLAAPPRGPDLSSDLKAVRVAIETHWPRHQAGPLLGWRLSSSDHGEAMVEIVHFGASLGESGDHLLRSLLSVTLAQSVQVKTVAVPTDGVHAEPEKGAEWLSELARAIETAERWPQLFVYVSVAQAEKATERPSRRAREPVRDPVASAAEAASARLPEGRVCRATGPYYAVRLSLEGCQDTAEEDAARTEISSDSGGGR